MSSLLLKFLGLALLFPCLTQSPPSATTLIHVTVTSHRVLVSSLNHTFFSQMSSDSQVFKAQPPEALGQNGSLQPASLKTQPDPEFLPKQTNEETKCIDH